MYYKESVNMKNELDVLTELFIEHDVDFTDFLQRFNNIKCLGTYQRQDTDLCI